MDLMALVMALKAQKMNAAEIRAAVEAYLEENPEAVDQAAIEALFADQLDGIEEDVGGLKSAVNGVQDVTLYNLGVVKIENVTIAKGTVKKPVFQLNLKSGKTVTFTVTLATAVDKPIYYYLYDKNGTALFPSTSRSIPSGSLTSTYDYTPAQDYDACTLKISVASTTSTDADFSIISISTNTDLTGIRSDVTTLEGEMDSVQENIEKYETAFTTKELTANVDLDDVDFTSGSYIGISGNPTTASGWRHGEYAIPAGAKTLTVTATAGQSARLWVLKNSGGTVLGYSEDSSAPSVKTETITLSNYTKPAKLIINDKNSSYVAISYTYNGSAISDEIVYHGNNPVSDYLDSNYLFGKTYVAVGDSITYGADMDSPGIAPNGERMSYPWIIAHRNHMTFYNRGVSGSTLAAGTNKNGFAEANGRYTQLPDNIDYLTIWFGWNDNASIISEQETLGTIASSDPNSYYGAWNTVLPYLIDKYPNCRIGLIVPFGCTAEMRQAVRDVAQKWGLAYFDNYQGNTPLYYGKENESVIASGLITKRRAVWQANGAHPSYAGHQQLATQIEAWMRTL